MFKKKMYFIGLLISAIGFSAAPEGLQAHKPVTSKYTYYQQIQPLFQFYCGGCHVSEGIAPMSLMTYKEAYPWAESIKEQLLADSMHPWHEDERLFQSLDYARKALAGMTTILQCHEQAMGELKEKKTMKMLGRHADTIDYVLFDASHGTGKTLDVEALDRFLEAAYTTDALGDVGFAVAGGLDAQTVEEKIPFLLAKYPDLSWDAEGRLHPLNNVGKRPLQMDIVKKYLQSSANVI